MSNTAEYPQIGEDEIWAELLSDPAPFKHRPALFLDRDGAIIDEVLYLHKPEEMRLIDGAGETIKRANALGLPVVIVTNQAGIGRAYYGWPEFVAVQEKMISELNSMGATIDAVFACPYHADGQGPYIHGDHPARKPNPGMLQRAFQLLSMDMANSWIAGDRAGDVGAGRNAGCAGGVHLRTGHGHSDEERDASLAWASANYRVHEAPSIASLTEIIPILQM